MYSSQVTETKAEITKPSVLNCLSSLKKANDGVETMLSVLFNTLDVLIGPRPPEGTSGTSGTMKEPTPIEDLELEVSRTARFYNECIP